MLKRFKFPPLIKACALSTNCTMGNLATQHTYMQSMSNLPRFITLQKYNTVVSNHVNSYHVPSFSCHDVSNVRQTTSGAYAICDNVNIA